MGSFERNGASLRFPHVGTTRMACPEPVMRREAAFLDALAATTRFELDGSSLVLLEDNRTLARLAASLR